MVDKPIQHVQGKSERAQKEEKILQFWKDNKIFEKTLEKKSPNGDFIFYEGPPTANGRPAIHHLEARAFKDAIPRYKTMQGFRVPRKAGWDTHGLPVELEVEKTLGLKSKKEIEEYGIAKFNQACRESVQKYIGEWAKFTDRIGYWVNLNNAYFTYDSSYIESVWSIVSHVEKRKLLYKDYKVVPWCPRCGTALSSHEIAQGYKDVKDLSLYVKFKIVGFPNAYFVAWTTTPWTLPGNVALAVGEDIDYVEIKVGEEILVLAKERLSLITEPYEIIAEHKGKEMIGMEYEPIYPFVEKTDKTFKIYSADFVNTEDGTGIVHTAVMYGQEDFDLGTKVGLPKVHLVSPDGVFMKGTDWLEGRSVVDETLAIDILKDLQKRDLLFGKENHTHSYPFCWRCKTRLIYYARDSWYIKMSELRDKLVAENKKINWEPEHIKEGRFGEWLREVKDWAISRERYWGTPLPIWQNADGSKKFVVDSVETLKKYAKKSGNKYFVMRHGRAQNNELNIASGNVSNTHALTEDGKKDVLKSAQDFNERIDFIFVSPFLRTKETAEIVREALGLSKEAVIEDVRLSEINFGAEEGQPIQKYQEKFPNTEDLFNVKPQGGENEMEVKQRVGSFLYEIENKYSGKNILVISHGDPVWMALSVAEGAQIPRMLQILAQDYPKYADIRELSFVPIPQNENFELDLHKPYIDDVVLVKDGEEYKRVKEVMDVWFDSGAMPFAQDPKNVRYPADFISEAIDQTRGWFYTLHAIGTLMEKGIAYKNVICLGHLLDKDGKKMSKSIGNVVDPWEEMDKHGADALRFWMYSVNQPGESKNFDTTTVAEIVRKVFNILDNVYAFYDMYRDKRLEVETKIPQSIDVLDIWILCRLSGVLDAMKEDLDEYRLLEPVRSLREFIDDLSTWYLRRSRERLKNDDINAKYTLYFVLKIISKMLAPFAPFTAEELFQKLRNEKDEISVHLTQWPDFNFGGPEPISYMRKVRELASLGLESRSRANIKVRQPLSKLTVKDLGIPDVFIELIKDELNVKEVVEDTNIEGEVELDTNLTPGLIEEGKVRDVIRVIQDIRKEKGLKPSDKMKYEVPDELKELFAKNAEEIKRVTNIEF
ncbi:MAG: class I tRNA ligase family protein [Minisyncoccia bacterium]